MINAKNLQKYDYESVTKNMLHYGSPTPPVYDISGNYRLFSGLISEFYESIYKYVKLLITFLEYSQFSQDSQYRQCW